MRFAFVPPWYGADIPGGAEVECRRWLAALRAAGFEVEVLTTCVRDHSSDWNQDYYKPGPETIDGVTVRRFPVRKRDTARFDQINYKLLTGIPVTPAEERLFIQESVRSTELEAFIADPTNDYYYIYLPYLFGTTYFGVQARPERAYLIPCLHDEAYARLAPIREMFELVQGCFYHSYPEWDLARSLYHLDPVRQHVVGEVVTMGWEGNAARARQHFGLQDPYLLYVGRRDPTKNTPLLIDYFCRYKEETGSPLKLLLLGVGSIAVPSEYAGEVIDGGYVPEQLKYDAYAGAFAICQPSRNESFSLIIMESWLAGVPVLVHDGCAVTRDHCQRANGGLYFADYNEFAACLTYLWEHPHIRERMGALGKRYVRENFTEERVLARFISALRRLEGALPH
jgi:glycosyltransferase involved in cell wall biosynthesis